MQIEQKYHPENTVPGRRGLSVIARFVSESGFANAFNIKSILDFGCGKGQDVEHYIQKGFDSCGYDPHTPFGYSDLPNGKFDLITLLFVLNVLPGTTRRISVIKKASEFMATNSVMIIVTRSPLAVNKEAQKLGWKRHMDGYWSNQKRGMFQKGLSKKDLAYLSNESDLAVHNLDSIIKLDSYSSSIIVSKT